MSWSSQPDMAEVCLNALGFRYVGADKDTLTDLNLTVADGSTHALLGASGAGKTTLLNLLSGLLPPTSGQILLNGRDVSQLGARDRNVALVFQFPVLYETKTVLENLMFPLLNRGWNLGDAEERARDIAGELEIDDALDKRPARLSLFQKQLTAIGKALIRTDVDLVLLDEPLTAVEPAKKWHLRQVLLRFQAAHNLTMVYVTHDQTEALTFASRVSVLADGRILQTGSPDDIYNTPINRYVGDFIGSPGMRFIDADQWVGPAALADLNLSDEHNRLSASTIGMRAEWVGAEQHPEGAWSVQSVSLEGTAKGIPKSLLALSQNGVELMSHAFGDWRVGDRAKLRVDWFVALGQEDNVRGATRAE